MSENFINKQNIKVIILAGCRDFGRCSLASHTHPALWPVAGQPAIERLLQHFSGQGIKQAIVCSNGDAPLLKESIADQDHIQLKFLDESLPVGTAGCIRDCADNDGDSLFVVLQGAITSPPNIDELIRVHQKGKSDLTVMFEPSCGNGRQSSQTAEIYICQPSILDYIPKGGYYDIKEGLIPKLLQAGRSIHAATMPQPVGNFRSSYQPAFV